MIKLFTHTDLDGIGCAVLAKLAFGDNADISYCNYNEINLAVKDLISSGRDYVMCHITDISISDNIAQEIDANYDNFYLMDHHPTALTLNKYNWCNIEIENPNSHIKTSGTEMYYNWLIENKYLSKRETLDRFVETIRNYDTWRWAELGVDGEICKKVNDLMYLYGREKFINWCIEEVHEGSFPKLHAADEMILDIKQKEIDEYIERKDKQLIYTEIQGKKCGVVYAEQYMSELGNRLCKMHPEIDFVAIIDMGNKTVSYRTTRDDIDLGNDIAKCFGGGGHPKAAGSQFTKEVQDKVISNIFINERMKEQMQKCENKSKNKEMDEDKLEL